ncbi:MAG: hypothetical protein DRP82_01815 [Planctomycetota bacterium]|nr:MAG: hypothetical protein DRP82_01815 [Planctomycetota bacterium]
MGFCAPDKRHTRWHIPRHPAKILSQITQLRTADRAFVVKRVVGFGVNRLAEFFGITPVMGCGIDRESGGGSAQIFQAELSICDGTLAFPYESCYDVCKDNCAEQTSTDETEPSRHNDAPQTSH